MLTFKIKPYLKSKNITLTKMAKDIGISRQSLSAISNNSVSMLNLNTINKIASYLNVPADELFIDDPDVIQISFDLKQVDNINDNSFLIISSIDVTDSFEGKYSFNMNMYMDVNNGEYSRDDNNVLANDIVFTLSIDPSFYKSPFADKIDQSSPYKNQRFVKYLVAKCLKTIDDGYGIPLDSNYFGITVKPDIRFWSFNFVGSVEHRKVIPAIELKDDYDNSNDDVNYIV